jgi:hypothetical protein
MLVNFSQLINARWLRRLSGFSQRRRTSLKYHGREYVPNEARCSRILEYSAIFVAFAHVCSHSVRAKPWPNLWPEDDRGLKRRPLHRITRYERYGVLLLEARRLEDFSDEAARDSLPW